MITGAKHAIAFSSGTAALHGAAAAASFGPGDQVLVPAVTFVASANCALYVGAEPRLVDIDPVTRNIDGERAAAIAEEDPRVKGAVAVSFAGLPVDLTPLREARGGELILIEDASHALGGTRNGQKVGGPGGADMTVFSLHPVKAMTTGEGGIVTTEDDALADRLRTFRTHGVVRDAATGAGGPWEYDMRSLGYNYRVTDFQAALGLSQLTRLDGWIESRDAIAERYRELLDGDTRIELPPRAEPGSLHGNHIFAIRITGGATVRLAVFEALQEAGIGLQVHYIPIYRFSYYRERFGLTPEEFPESERYYSGALTLPLFPALTEPDIERVVRELDLALAGAGEPDPR